MRLLDRINALMFSDPDEITEEVIEHYERNPDELDLIIDREHFNIVYLAYVLVLGLAITILARWITVSYGDQLGPRVNTLVLDVISEMGIAIFGGAIVAYLIESLNKRQFQRNVQFRRKMKKILEERREAQSREP
ncbi:MAG: hypothetical protein AAGF11_21765 [Myxococcota bacterium]